MNVIWQIHEVKALPLIFQIGFKNGLKAGDRPRQSEYLEVWQRHPDWIEPLGATELNNQELANEWASHNKKVLWIKENK